MRAFQYIRVSDEEQVKEGFSIDAQKALLNRKFLEWGWECIGVYIDYGFSAKNMKRPDFQKMMKEITIKRPDVIAFWRMDRFTRSSKDFHKVMEQLGQSNCGIRSATEVYDTTTAMGKFQLELAISLGQLERETTAERVKFVMEERHRKGIRQGSVAPFGYRLEEKELVVDPEQAAIVRRVYEDYTKPMSDTAVAKQFNKEGIMRPSGTPWNGFSIGYILTNPTYCGKLRWNFRKLEGKRTYDEIIVDGTHEPIIPVEEFDRIQAIRKRRSITKEKVSKDFVFTGVLKCSRCGYGMIGLTQRDTKTGKSRRYYRCLGRANYGVCGMPQLSEQTVNEAFIAALDIDNEQFKKLIKVPDKIQEDDIDQAALKRDLDSILKRRKKWQEAFANDAITLSELKAHMDDEKAKEEFVRGHLESASASAPTMWNREDIIKQFTTLRDSWYSITDNFAKKAFIQEMYKEIVIHTPVIKGTARPGKLIPSEIVDWKLN